MTAWGFCGTRESRGVWGWVKKETTKGEEKEKTFKLFSNL